VTRGSVKPGESRTDLLKLALADVIVLAQRTPRVLAGVMERDPVQRRARPAVIWLGGLDAACALTWLAIHPAWFRRPPDWQVLGWAGFELIALATSVLALRRMRAAVVGAWTAFGVHGIASALAALFALTFKITRLF